MRAYAKSTTEPTDTAIDNALVGTSRDGVLATSIGRSERGEPCSCHAALPDDFRRAWLGRNLSDWLPALFATVGSRKPSCFTAIWRLFNRLSCEGLDNIPPQGPFVLALNHIKDPGSAVTLLGAALAAVAQRRPDAIDEMQAIVGFREPNRPQNFPTRVVRSLWEWTKARWSRNLLHVPLTSRKHSVSGLMRWRKSADQRPSLVFAEGISRPLFGPVRKGAGTWLGSLSAPTLPVGVWWHAGRWHVLIGKPVHWSDKRELHDVQLGYRIAQLLPEPLIDSHWRALLARAERLRDCEGPARLSYQRPKEVTVAQDLVVFDATRAGALAKNTQASREQTRRKTQ